MLSLASHLHLRTVGARYATQHRGASHTAKGHTPPRSFTRRPGTRHIGPLHNSRFRRSHTAFPLEAPPHTPPRSTSHCSQGQWRLGTSKQHPYETDVRLKLLVRGPDIASGARMPHLVGSVDIMPTLLELACDGPFVAPRWQQQCTPPPMDGRSFASLLLPSQTRAAQEEVDGMRPWRDTFLVEYRSVGTYFNDHSITWAPPGYATRCGGGRPRGPGSQKQVAARCKTRILSSRDKVVTLSPELTAGNESNHAGCGACYVVDSLHSNSWRMLRILNSTHDWTYVEYDPSWRFLGTLQHHELYDNRQDPYQLRNLFPETHSQMPHQSAALAAELAAYWSCSGASCP